jgi:histidinol-phosphate/aromatic aminotransferase/cobyric acid decarboxylase-like protein
VARTFSKAYGLAGLRIGVLAGDATQMAMVRRVASPYSVNVAALAVLPEAIHDQEYVNRYVAEVRRNRERLQLELGSLACITGRATRILFWSASAQPTPNLCKRCAIAEFWCATGTLIPDAKAASA